MARKVDVEQHEQRKEAIVQAVWRLVARAGLEAVSLREVAAEAHVSMGRVQHYFRTKDEMLLYGLKLAQDRMRVRIEQRLPSDDEGVLRAAVDELLGDDPDTRQAVRVWVAFLGRALEDPRVAKLLYADDVELRAFTAGVVSAANPALDAEREAHIIWSLANSLAAEVACGETTAHTARTTLRYHLDRVLGGGGEPSLPL
ncbi:TetR/AcrR family transcriptional regulator [Lentzea tibetensis]|nr:TetR/AcrR family transcriptional regulator [Lentzea tibetensis]